MKYRRLGNSDIRISEIGLGCWTMGGLSFTNGHDSGWAPVDAEEIRSAIAAAVERGVNHFDNADVYGDGDAERLLASCLSKSGLKSTEFIISSKVGHAPIESGHPYETENIRRQCERSLRNLNRDYIDIYYLHHGDFGKEDRYLAEAASAMQTLKQEGKIREIGQSAYTTSQFAKSAPVIKPAVLQGWAHLMDTKFITPSGIVGRLMESQGISFIAFSPLNQGLLTGKYDPSRPPVFPPGDHRRNASKFSPEALAALAPKLEALGRRFGSSPAELASVALRFVLNHPNVAGVIPGFRNPRQALDNLAAVDLALDSGDMEWIRNLF